MLCYLIDDDEDDQEFFAIALQSIDRPIRLETASCADDALRDLLSRSEQPDIIFVDINMPRIDGWECLRLLRGYEHLRQIPTIVYSTSVYEHLPPPAEEFTGYLTKQSKISD